MNISKEDIEILRELEQKQNDGRGVSCVRSILHYLDKEDEHTAGVVRTNEGDKTRSYPDIERHHSKLSWMQHIS